MKKLLTLVLVLAVASMASAAATFTVTDNLDGTVDIDYTGEIVGLALDIDATGGLQIATATLPAFFDVYMDFAYAEGGAYVYGTGTPYATQGVAGVATMPSSSFCISAGGLEDDGTDLAPLSGTITLTIDGYASLTEGTYTITVAENSLRGGVVGFDGAMTTDLTTTGTVDIVIESGDTPEQISWDAKNVNGDATVNLSDASALVSYINGNATAPFWSVAVQAGVNDQYDVNGDGNINLSDASALVSYINGNATAPFWSVSRPQ